MNTQYHPFFGEISTIVSLCVFLKAFFMVVLILNSMSVAAFHQVTTTGSCLTIAFVSEVVTKKQDLKTKQKTIHQSKVCHLSTL